MTSKTPTPSNENKAMAEMFQHIAQHGGGPAYPMQMELGKTDDGQPYTWFTVGLTKREKFAAMMMAAQIQFEGMEGCDKEHIASMSCEIADALLEGLKK